jgi:hypothetical protein
MPRTLISDDGVTRRYRVTNAGGQQIGFDEEHVPTVTEANAATIAANAQAALAVNDTYLAIVSPTAGQVATQVSRLTRECTGIIRLLLGVLDSTSDT